MKLLFVYYTHKPGGLCTRLYRLLAAAARAGHEVTYLALDPPPAALEPGIKFRRLSFPLKRRRGALFWLLFSAFLPAQILIECARRRPDRLIAFAPYYACALAPAALLLRCPIVLFMRALPSEIARLLGEAPALISMHRFSEYVGAAIAARVICTTEAMRGRFQGSPRILSKCRVLGNDLPALTGNADIRTLLPAAAQDAAFAVLASGVLDRRKNLAILIDACSLMPPPTRAKSVLIIAGDGPLRSELQARAASTGARTIFIGWKDQLSAHLSGVSLAVHPALHEGMSNSILEALAAGVPALAADTPENRELLGADELLFAPNDAAALARRIAAAIEDDAERSKIAQLSRAAAERRRFDWDAAALDATLAKEPSIA